MTINTVKDLREILEGHDDSDKVYLFLYGGEQHGLNIGFALSSDKGECIHLDAVVGC